MKAIRPEMGFWCSVIHQSRQGIFLVLVLIRHSIANAATPMRGDRFASSGAEGFPELWVIFCRPEYANVICRLVNNSDSDGSFFIGDYAGAGRRMFIGVGLVWGAGCRNLILRWFRTTRFVVLDIQVFCWTKSSFHEQYTLHLNIFLIQSFW